MQIPKGNERERQRETNFHQKSNNLKKTSTISPVNQCECNRNLDVVLVESSKSAVEKAHDRRPGEL